MIGSALRKLVVLPGQLLGWRWRWSIIHHVSVADDAVDTLDAEHLPISGVITDIQLKGRLDGWAIARHARALVPHIPIVYMSGDSAPEHLARGVPDSIMIHRPFAPAQIITAISTLLNAVPPQQPD